MSMRRCRKRKRVEPTHDWKRLVPLFEWPEQESYEAIRPLVLFGEPVAERAEQTGVSERTLYRRVEGFEHEGMESLFATEKARRKRLPPAMRRLIVDLKAEYPALNLSEIANIVYVRFGRRPEVRTVTKGARGGTDPPQDLKEVRSLPRDRRGQGAQDGHREAPRRRLEREGHIAGST
jgi:hypothetical protein